MDTCNRENFSQTGSKSHRTSGECLLRSLYVSIYVSLQRMHGIRSETYVSEEGMQRIKPNPYSSEPCSVVSRYLSQTYSWDPMIGADRYPTDTNREHGMPGGVDFKSVARPLLFI